MAEVRTPARIPPAWAVAMTSVAAIGVGLALYLVNVKLRLEFDPTFQSSCNFNSKLNCDLVQTSTQSLFMGYPLALWGAVTYLSVMGLALFAMKKPDRARSIVALLSIGGVAVCLHTLYLAYVSTFVIGAYCVYCIGMYGVNLALTWLALSQWRRHRNASEGGLLMASGQPMTVLAAAITIAVMAGLALPTYNTVRARRSAARIAAVKKQVARLDAGAPAKAQPAGAPPAATTPDTTPGSTAAGTTAAGTTAAGTTAAGTTAAGTALKPRKSSPAAGPGPNTGLTIRTHRQGFRYSLEVMRKGRSYYEVPVSAADFPLGPADAPVTVVEFADFECGYCRVLTANLKPLKKKYAGKVRWVFKHFPLDNRCNKVMKGTQHPDACIAAKASNCAGLQGKFWPMHDRIYERKLRINPPNLRRWAKDVGVDLVKYDACFADDAVGHAKTRADSRAGRFARISGTPRSYINGHLVPGVNATEVLDYYLKAALSKAALTKARSKAQGTAERQAAAPARQQHRMVEQKTSHGTFWIDAFEASLDGKGRAVSVTNVRPAEVSWFEARDACKKAGKRLCTEEEWISACTGAPAVDNDDDHDFSDDAVEGSLFPYGLFHEGGRCNDDQRGTGHAVATGAKPKCVSPAGVFDQSGNLAEWTGRTEATGMLSGTDFRWGPKATCMKRQDRFGLGYRNATTGFRCCADRAVPPPSRNAAPAVVAHQDHGVEGKPAPRFTVLRNDGGEMTESALRKHVTIVTFFASWCGPCRRELPDLNKFYGEHKKDGLKILAIGVDKRPQAAKDFVASLGLKYDAAFDPKAVAMGAFGVKGMPTAFLVGRDGRILRRLVGINAAKVAAFKAAALAALKAR